MPELSRRNLILAAVICLVPTGCEQYYTGGIGFRGNERKAVAEYQAQREAQNAQLGTGQSANNDQPEINSVDTTFQAMEVNAAQASDVQPVYTSNMSTHAIGAMGLYGQIEMPPGAEGVSSPMDGIGNLQRVTLTTEGADFDPDVDPVGRNIVYASTRHRETSDLYLKKIGGNAITQLTDDPANDVMPAISPDGQRIAFASDRAGNWDVYLMDIRGGKAIQITRDSTHDIHPTWSPDGSRLVYSSFGSPSGQWEMVVIDVQNPATKQFIGYGLFPTWSPTENKILYQRARQRGTRWFSVWTIDMKPDGDAGQPTELAASANAAVITPDWSPDGKHIVFCTVIDPKADESQGPAQADIWVMDAEGGNRTRLTDGKFSNLQPAWASSGSIYFVSDRGVDGIENVWAMKPDEVLQLAARKEDDDLNAQTPSVMVPTE